MKKPEDSTNFLNPSTKLDAYPLTTEEFQQEVSASSGEEKDVILPDLSLLEIDDIDDSYPFC